MGVDPPTPTHTPTHPERVKTSEESPDPACSPRLCPYLFLFALPQHSILTTTRTKQMLSVSMMPSPNLIPRTPTTTAATVPSTSALSIQDHSSTLVTGSTA